jgi:hypothetical protein
MGGRWLGSLALVLALMSSPAASVASQMPQPGTPAPEIAGGPWINSSPLTLTALRGRVVLIDVWTYG